MPNIDLSILNQRQTPAFYADVFANRPAAGYVGRIFVSTDTFAFYRDNGTGWDLIGGPGTGTVTGSGASGQIALWSGASTIAGDTGLTYNGTDNSLTASKFIVTGGTSSQFLKADGSVDSSSYVPYTGATASLNMGANNILAQNYLVNGNNVNSGGYLGIKQFSGSSSGQLGYTSISALTQNSLYFQFSQTNGTNKTFELSAGLLGTSTVRQFQLPDADGTIALTSNIPSVSGAAGQVSYFNGTNSITGSNDLFWDSVNGHLGVNTNVPGTALDVHHDQPTVAILNQTVATNDVRIGFQNNGVGLWRIGAFYNAGANDFGIYDAVAALQPVTVKKTTGQVLIGTSNVGSGKLVVASNIGDNGIQIVGASAPSLRIDSAESGPTKRAGLGISTATNNFIQGSADRDFCIFNGSTAAASPILFGIYDAGAVNVQEAARISPARNFLVGTVTDAGYKLAVNGTINAAGTIYSQPTTNANGLIVVNGTSGSYGGNVAFQRGGTQDGVIGTKATNNNIITGATNADICILADGGGRSIRLSTTNASPQLSLKSSGILEIGYVDALNSAMELSWAGASSYGAIQTSSSSILALNPSGNNVAIGRTTAFNKLTVKTGTGNNLDFFDTGSAFGIGLQSVNDTNTAYKSWDFHATKFSFLNGNLLIGTTTDNGYKLQVNGFINSLIGRYVGQTSLSIPANNTDYVLYTTAVAGMFTMRDNTNGGSQLWLLDPNGGAILVANSFVAFPTAIVISYNGGTGQWLIRKTAGSAINVGYAIVQL